MIKLHGAWCRFRNGFMRAVHVLGTINAHIIFGILYVVGIGAYALVGSIARLFSNHTDSEGWIKEQGDTHTLDELRRQF